MNQLIMPAGGVVLQSAVPWHLSRSAPVLLDGYPCRPVRISSYEVSSRNHAESK